MAECGSFHAEGKEREGTIRPFKLPIIQLVVLATVLSGLPSAASGQTRETAPAQYTLVSEYLPPAAMFVNPAMFGIMRNRNSIVGQATWARSEEQNWRLAQYLIGFQAKYFGFGYTHDEFQPGSAFSQGDAYTILAGGGKGNAGFGGSVTFRTVGSSQPSWVVGAGYATRTTSIGAVFRDIGSPTVRDTVRDSRIVSALTVRPNEGTVTISAELDYNTNKKDIRLVRGGAGASLAGRVRAQALVAWNGDGDFEGFLFFVRLRLGQDGGAFGAAGLDAGGDAGSGTLGLDLTQSTGRR